MSIFVGRVTKKHPECKDVVCLGCNMNWVLPCQRRLGSGWIKVGMGLGVFCLGVLTAIELVHINALLDFLRELGMEVFHLGGPTLGAVSGHSGAFGGCRSV